ncbi:unnamed protein product [Rotaria magnacalcarata]|uniref:N-acetyltransferase domain-containing protein n=1 Tax=Rotaria magnacalcarata TaxID=392030 RepID=A0A817AL14_9BILA|nr:unnamed protein product [Rotaria magnacalcarata]CAF2264254.1 unnamed protein product [Rotaria magnacalcarata]CAF3843434.1 unnamed protein product [Rotaria magnacalcarata]CAF3912282.1 unnamed protein product [Rotaria magnacalcarata]
MSTSVTTPSIIIRSYQAADLSACQALIIDANKDYENPVEYYELAFQTDMADIEKSYLQVPNAHWWVAVSTEDKRIVGQVALQPLHLGDPLYYKCLPLEERDQICELRRMSVHSTVQRLGIGSRLLETLLSFAREHGYRQVHLTTLTNMSKACSYYEKLGFARGDVYRYSLADVSTSLISKTKEHIGTILPTPVIFKQGDIIPAEDQEHMKLPLTKAKYIYSQNFFLTL